MPKTTFTVTLPDGTPAKRTSENRTYTHAIAVCDTVGHRLGKTREELASQEKMTASYRAVVAAGEVEARYARTLTLADYERFVVNGEAREATLREAIAALEARPADEELGWGVSGWAGRPDLAEKAARSAAKWSPLVRVIPVD